MSGQFTQRILLVDDAPLIRKVPSSVLVGAGYVVGTAVDGFDGIGRLRQGAPDLIASDLMMPRMSRFEFLRVVGQRFPEVPVLAISCDLGSLGIQEGASADMCFSNPTAPAGMDAQILDRCDGKNPICRSIRET